ncbi:MAG TPA: alkaline phosphatase D family protein [Mycobacteriales bacterium]|nr:alkaline phosphatase D family protein [Mycobacteriales bacterium]
MPALLLGPLLRYVDETSATIWVETDGPCEVTVLAHREPTTEVCGRHYALVAVTGLAAASTTQYDVRLDGEQVWPLPGRPPSAIRTVGAGGHLRIVTGSCRRSAPDSLSYRRYGDDALRVYAAELAAAVARSADRLPDLLLLVGDQVYADRPISPARQDYYAARPLDEAPPGQPVSFAEYAAAYVEAWSQPDVRWLLSTVPSSMIFDDHEVVGDWNQSAAWAARMERTGWWPAARTAALTAYAVYQHAGNLPAPAGQATLARLGGTIRARPPAGPWGHARSVGDVRIVVLDCRAGRRLTEGDRSIVPDEDWAALDAAAGSEARHLVVVSSVPVLLPAAIAYGESWADALAAGAWGNLGRRVGGVFRSVLGFEHWAAFPASLARICDVLAGVAASGRTVLVVSGDVHYGYLATMGDTGVWQLVSSPLRNPLKRITRTANRAGDRRSVVLLLRVLARLAGVPALPTGYAVTDGPWFDNQVATLDLTGPSRRIRLGVVAHGRLRTVLDRVL